jgi:hypothetical protein
MPASRHLFRPGCYEYKDLDALHVCRNWLDMFNGNPGQEIGRDTVKATAWDHLLLVSESISSPE